MTCLIHGYFEGWCDLCQFARENDAEEISEMEIGDGE